MSQSAAPVETTAPKRAWSFPTPATILLVVIVVVWVITFFIPSGRYRTGPDCAPIPNSFTPHDLGLTFMDRLGILLESPINAMYGVQNPHTHLIGPWYSGLLVGAAPVFLFILAIGGFMTVVFRTGALTLGIAHLAKRFETRGPLLIIILCVVFGILGSVKSWSDESLGFYPLMIPLMLGLGYDRVVTVAVVTVAPFVGSIGATVNPFRIGVAAEAAGTTMADGLGLRLIVFVVTLAAVIWYILRYAKRVKDDPSRSLCGLDDRDRAMLAERGADEIQPLTGRHKVLIGLVIFTFVLMAYSMTPWSAILNNSYADDYTGVEHIKPFAWELGWWLPELTVLFIVMAIVIGVVARLGEGEIAGSFLRGVADFSGPAALVVLAMSVSVIMTNTQTIDTMLNAMEGLVSGRSSAVFIVLLAVVSVPLAALVGSGSAGMALVMPILAPLGDFAGVDRSLIITTYNAVGGWVLLFLPMNAILMAGLALARVGFGVYLRFMWKLLLIEFGLIVVLLLAGLVM